MFDGMCCCNIEVGLAALAHKTALVFINLNLLLTFIGDDQGAKLLRPCISLEKFKLSQRHGLSTITRLLPRPAYMNTTSFSWMFEEVLDEHGHAVEHVLFNPLFAPPSSGRLSKRLRPDADSALGTRFEQDVMADGQVMGKALKHL